MSCQVVRPAADSREMGEPVHVIFERRRQPGGCGTTIALLILIGLAVKYWYVTVALTAILIAVAVGRHQQSRQQARRQPGVRDPWLNEVVVALTDLGLTELCRNTGSQLGNVALEGDVGLQADRFLVYVNLFGSAALARQAEIALRAQPAIQAALAAGRTAVRTEGRVVYVANGRGSVVDEFRLDDIVRVVGRLRVPPPIGLPRPQSGSPENVVSGDALEQLRRLADLHRSGAVTQAEFEAKKADLLDRI